jgi:hypothetical protein
VTSLRPRFFTVSMSRSRVFLGGLVSTSARLRFPGCPSECNTISMPVEGIATIGTTNLPGLLANEEMAKTVEPGALETCNGEQAIEAVKLVRTRAQRIPSCAQSICSPKGRIHLRRPPAIFTFRLQYGDGPYIHHRRQHTRNRLPRLGNKLLCCETASRKYRILRNELQ